MFCVTNLLFFSVLIFVTNEKSSGGVLGRQRPGTKGIDRAEKAAHYYREQNFDSATKWDMLVVDLGQDQESYDSLNLSLVVTEHERSSAVRGNGT
jgi:hypothetical protein